MNTETPEKYENRYFRKQIWNEYGADADEKQMIVGTKSERNMPERQ
jgi:hypothetical protein